MKKAYYFNQAVFTIEKSKVETTIKHLNIFLSELKRHDITIDQADLIGLIQNDKISFERLQTIIDVQVLAANPKIQALDLPMEKVKMLIDFPNVKTWELDLFNVQWIAANPASFAIVGMVATLSKNWEKTLQDQCSMFATNEKELQRLELILQIEPLMKQFAELADEPFDWSFSLFEQEYDGSVHIRPDAITYGCEPLSRFQFQETSRLFPVENPPVEKKVDWNSIPFIVPGK